ncbi:MAG: phenylalanine--tRNA ligase subunit alpha [Treponema sp.]|nr:MAG: phenylalanine--tRNA ligase subunit alpha [Treponema sp.]
MEDIIKNLHPLEIKVLNRFNANEHLTVQLLQEELNYKEGHANQVFSWLTMKGLLSEISRKTQVFYLLTDLGNEYCDLGTPEERIIKLLQDGKPRRLPEISKELNLDNKNVGTAFGALSKAGCLKMDSEKRAKFIENKAEAKLNAVRNLLERAKKADNSLLKETELFSDELSVIKGIAKKRGAADSMFKIIERDAVVFALNKNADKIKSELKTAGLTGDETGQLTAENLKTGAWKTQTFRPYNIGLPPARIIPGRRNAYSDFLENVKDKLVALGFEEMGGNLVETDFWNSDALFMPQFHAARDIHDVYYIKQPSYAKTIEEPFLTNVAKAHETGGDTGSRGWNYKFDKNFTKKLLLRSQGTVCSARKLAEAKVPGKYFTISRCFRYDKVDATHLSDFYQLDGIILGEKVNLKTLLGVLKMFAVEIAGATEVKYVAAYFPFTEPSIEIHVKHPVLGWFELGGAGIFRPEVTKSQGVDVPVLAWGIGIDRMALMALGINDLRELFSYDIETVRLRK